MSLEAIKYKDGSLEILDQLLLPIESKYIPVRDTNEGWAVIKKMQVGLEFFTYCLASSEIQERFSTYCTPYCYCLWWQGGYRKSLKWMVSALLLGLATGTCQSCHKINNCNAVHGGGPTPSFHKDL